MAGGPRDELIELATALPTGDEGTPTVMTGSDLVPSPACGDASTHERVREGLVETASPRSPVEAVPVISEAGGRPDLERMVERAVVAAAAGCVEGPQLDKLRAGLEWLVSLDPEREVWWGFYGRLVEHGAGPSPSPSRSPGLEPPGPLAHLAFTLGRLRTLVDRQDEDGIRRLLHEDRGLAVRIIDLPEAAPLVGTVLGVRLDQPRAAAQLAAAVDAPFDGWANLVGRARDRAATLLHQGAGGEAEVLLAAMEDMLWRWTAGAGADPAVVRQAARTALLRAECRRRRGDFVGAGRLLAGLDVALLDTEDRARAARETGLAAAELTGLDAVAFPRAGEWAHLRDRLQRARPHLEAALEADPAQLDPAVLLGMLACCEDDDAAASVHLTRSRHWLAGRAELDHLARATAFHAALARLRLLEPGTDEGAYRDLTAALEGGYRPDEEALLGAAEALDAHGSPHAGAFLSTVAGVAPTSVPIAALVAEWARRGDEAAGRTAEELGGTPRLSLTARFELLDAALAGAERRRDVVAADRLVHSVDEVVARAAHGALDDRWADTLAFNETLRLVLEPAHTDALRIEVLRRAGRVDEARDVARALFHRAAAGTLHEFAAGDLLELLGELGAEGEELERLSALVRERPPVAEELAGREAPVVVVFVGGNQVQAGYRPHVDAALAERYGEAVRVEWFIPGWGSNWGRDAEHIEAAYDGADVVVLMTFVRTNLGRWVRRTAGEHGLPWVACTGHGRGAIERAIDYAVGLSGAA